jgi:hypothetical protein
MQQWTTTTTTATTIIIIHHHHSTETKAFVGGWGDQSVKRDSIDPAPIQQPRQPAKWACSGRDGRDEMEALGL